MAIRCCSSRAAARAAYQADAELASSLREALGADYEVRYPAMPGSIGASVIIKLLTEASPSLSAAFLVAGPFWHNDEFLELERGRAARDAASRIPAASSRDVLSRQRR